MGTFGLPDDDEDWEWQDANLPDPSDQNAVDEMIYEPTSPQGTLFDQISREDAEQQLDAALMPFPEERLVFIKQDRIPEKELWDLYKRFVLNNGNERAVSMDTVYNHVNDVQPSASQTNQGQGMFSDVNLNDFKLEDFEFEHDPTLDQDMEASSGIVDSHPEQLEEDGGRMSVAGVDLSHLPLDLRQTMLDTAAVPDHMAAPQPDTQPGDASAMSLDFSTSSTPMNGTRSLHSMSDSQGLSMSGLNAVHHFNMGPEPTALALPAPTSQAESTPATTTPAGWENSSATTMDLTPATSPMSKYTSLGSLPSRGAKRSASVHPEGNQRARRLKKNAVTKDIDIDENSRRFLDEVTRQTYAYPGGLRFDNIGSVDAALERLQGLYRKPARECTFPGQEMGADNSFPKDADAWKPFVELVMQSMMDWSSYIEWNQVVPKAVKDQRDLELIAIMNERSRSPNIQGNTLEVRDLMPSPHIQATYLQDIPRQQKIVLGRPSNAFDAECLAWLLVKYAQDAQRGQTHSRPWTTKMDGS